MRIIWKLIIVWKYDNYLLIVDFNVEPNEPAISEFCEIYKKTCFTNLENPTCVDLILTNRPRSFQNLIIIEMGLTDFYKMCVTVMKMHY